MEKLIFSAALGLIYGVLIWWGARSLPGERWQIAASIPLKKGNSGIWRGMNLTFYGLFTANSVLLSASLVLVMLGSLGVSPFETMILCTPVLLISAVSARIVARWVEKKSSTFTVAGASFIGLLMTPWVVVLCRGVLGGDGHPGIQVTPVMAAVVTCWTLGEGMGRLACLSFGCCYGRSLAQCPRWMQILFKRRHLVFSGPTKKISYESGLDGQAVAPVQVLTSLVCGAAGLASLYLFLESHFSASLWLGLTVSGCWRVISEVFRADFRGGRRFTAYQWMALAAIPYGVLVSLFFPVEGASSPSLIGGLGTLWNPTVILALQGVWLGTFLYTGASKVTASTIEFHVVSERI